MVANDKDLAGLLPLKLANRGEQPLIKLKTSLNIAGICLALEVTLSFVIRVQTIHVERVTKVDEYVRVKISNQLTNPACPVVVVVRVGVGVRDYEVYGYDVSSFFSS